MNCFSFLFFYSTPPPQDVKKPMGTGPGNVGVFFCGNPIIGRDLAKCSASNSDPNLDQQFHLHKENF
jgi:hypothetical protein